MKRIYGNGKKSIWREYNVSVILTGSHACMINALLAMERALIVLAEYVFTESLVLAQNAQSTVDRELKLNRMSYRVQYIKQNLHKSQSQICKELGIDEDYLLAICDWNDIELTGWYWTEKEEQLLKDHYRKSSKEKIKTLIPRRSWDSIIKKAYALGLSRKRGNYQTKTRISVYE